MNDQPINTAWMWKADDGLNGMKINQDRRMIEWYDSVGCACGDSTETQSYGEFLSKGPKFASMPEDVESEVRESLARLEDNA